MSIAKKAAPHAKRKIKEAEPQSPARQFAALWLKHQADTLLGIPPGSDLPLKLPLPDLPQLMVLDRLRLANYLRRIAASPAAMKAITMVPKPSAKRGRPKQSVRNHKIALDYLVVYHKHGKQSAAIAELRLHWKVGRSAILDIYEDSQKDNHWLQWAQYVLRQAKIEDESLEEISRKLRRPDKPG